MTGLQYRLASLVRGALADIGMTQSELAVAIGVSDKHMSQLLNGVQAGSLQVWDAMLRELRIPIEDLV